MNVSLNIWYGIIRILIVVSLIPITYPSPVESASVIYSQTGFTSNFLNRNDDGSTGLVDIGFAVNFYGLTYSQLYVNNNGNVTFDASQSTYTPYDLTSTGRKIIAAFFADVDTRNWDSNVVTYGQDFIDGRRAFGVNYLDVGYYNTRADKRNSFQLVLIDRSNISAGDFDIVFNYEKIQWETGDASGGSYGFGGASARVGYSNGTRDPGTYFELPGSGVPSAFLDGSITSLTGNYNNPLGISGRYVYKVRNGSVERERNPIVFVPGIMGSDLVNANDSNTKYWPKTRIDDFWPLDNYDALKLNGDGGDIVQVKASGVMWKVKPPLFDAHPVYQPLLDYFTTQMTSIGYENYTNDGDFIPCPYDWRKSIEHNARTALAICVEQARSKNPDKQVDILAHSMGGLVSQRYILMDDGVNAEKIGHLVTIGTPYFGASKTMAQLINGSTVPDDDCSILTCGSVLSSDQSMRIIKNFPGVYDLLPHPYYQALICESLSASCLRPYFTYLGAQSNTYDETMDRLAGLHNSILVNQTKQWQTGANMSSQKLTWHDQGTKGVEVISIVGTGYDTPARISVENVVLFESDDPFIPDTVGPRAKWASGLIDGDGTVPTVSASMRNSLNGTDYSGAVTSVYCVERNSSEDKSCQHMPLAKNPKVLKFAADIFHSGVDTRVLALQRAQGMKDTRVAVPNVMCVDKNTNQPIPCTSVEARTIPRVTDDFLQLEPSSISGDYFEFDGGVEVQITDQFGNYIRTASDGTYQVTIPKAGVNMNPNSYHVFLPADRTYTFVMNGKAVSKASLKVTKYLEDEITQTTFFADMNVTTNSVANLVYDPQVVTNTIELDYDGDGSTDTTSNVTQTLTGTQAQDADAPTVTINLKGVRSDTGWYVGRTTVTLTATDSNSGVKSTTYSINNGRTFTTYTQPFVINATTVKKIIVKSEDNNGNVRQIERAAPTVSRSLRQYDGSIIERRQSNVGGTIDVTNQFISVGDMANRSQQIGILAFNTQYLPDNAIITRVTLRVKHAKQVGNPWLLGRMQADVMQGNFGGVMTLQPSDFQANATKNAVATFARKPVSGWYEASFTDIARASVNVSGMTQFRIKFSRTDNTNRKDDLLMFYSGNAVTANQPQLLIEYTLP